MCKREYDSRGGGPDLDELSSLGGLLPNPEYEQVEDFRFGEVSVFRSSFDPPREEFIEQWWEDVGLFIELLNDRDLLPENPGMVILHMSYEKVVEGPAMVVKLGHFFSDRESERDFFMEAGVYVLSKQNGRVDSYRDRRHELVGYYKPQQERKRPDPFSDIDLVPDYLMAELSRGEAVSMEIDDY